MKVALTVPLFFFFFFSSFDSTQIFFLIPLCPGTFTTNPAVVGRGHKMATPVFARAVRAASGQWKTRCSIYLLRGGGTCAGWNRRLSVEVNKRKKKKKARGLFRILSGTACVRPAASEVPDTLGPWRTWVSSGFRFLTGSWPFRLT